VILGWLSTPLNGGFRLNDAIVVIAAADATSS